MAGSCSELLAGVAGLGRVSSHTDVQRRGITLTCADTGRGFEGGATSIPKKALRSRLGAAVQMVVLNEILFSRPRGMAGSEWWHSVELTAFGEGPYITRRVFGAGVRCRDRTSRPTPSNVQNRKKQKKGGMRVHQRSLSGPTLSFWKAPTG
jgi:hypothetical protein